MKKIFITLLLNILYISLPFCNAQFSVFQNFNVGNGLSNNFVHGIIQDGKGRIWVATEAGLNCYDGYRFTIYKSYNSVLKSNCINTLYYDAKHHVIWVGVKGLGIYTIDENTGGIYDRTPQHTIINNIMSISPASDGGLWLTSHDQILHYSYQQHKFSTFISNKHKESYRMAVEDFHGRLLIANYYEGYKIINIKNKKETKILNNPINKEYVYKFHIDKQHHIWIATNYGLRLMNTTNLHITKINELENSIVCDMNDYGRYKLIATNTGLQVFDPSSQKVILTRDIKNIWYIYLDHYSNLWIGTLANGIYFLSKTHKPFKNILPQKVICMTTDGQSLWIGGQNAIYLVQGNQLKHTYTINYMGFHDKVLSIQNEDQQHFLIAIFSRLFRFNKQTGNFYEIKYKNRSLSAITFYKDDTHKIWITTNRGIYSIKNGIIYEGNKLNKVLGNQITNCMRNDAKGNLWIGTIENGIYVFDSHQRFLRHLSQSKSFFSNSVMHMQKGSNNRIWLATTDGIGLITNNSNSFDCYHYNYKQGLKDPFIRAIREDKYGNAWVCTNNGLSYLNMKTGLFSNFEQNDGIPTSNFTGGLQIFPNGTAYATSLEGLITFNINQLTAKRQCSPIYFTRCMVLNASVEQMSEQLILPDKNRIYQLNHNQNDIRVIFSVGNKAQSKLVDYSYKVDNLVNNWTLTDENIITFRSLSPGKYTIRVRARLHGQSWDSASTSTMTIFIAQPIWWTWYARILYLCIILICTYLTICRYKHHLQIKNALELEKRKNIAEQEINREKLQFFTNIAHELRTPLTLIYGPLEELEQNNTLDQEGKYTVNIIKKNAQRLLELINRLMEFRKTETGNQQLVVSKSDFKQTVEEIGKTFKDGNQNPSVNYIIDIEETSPYIYYDKNVIKSILSNLLNNASKYTSRGVIGLSLTQSAKEGHQYSCIKVWDTGCGIEKKAIPHIFDRYYQVNGNHQASGTGIGLSLVKNLCEQHKIQVTVESELGKGTVFTLLIDNEETYQEALHKENIEESETKESFRIETKNISHQKDERPIILTVEDNVEINNYIAHSLQKDYHVLQAFNGKEGASLAKETIPEIIICDIMMPIMDGLTLTKELKSDISTSHIPIIMLTAKTSQEDRQECYTCGANSFITKPFSIGMLRTRIENLMAAQKSTAAFIMQKLNTSHMSEKDEKVKLNVLDQKFIDHINEIITNHIASEKLNLTMLAEELKISQSTLYRKMKALTGVSGNEYIRKMRLRHSLQLMLEDNKNISEAAFESGFVDLAYFRTCFKEEFGEVPSDYLKNLRPS